MQQLQQVADTYASVLAPGTPRIWRRRHRRQRTPAVWRSSARRWPPDCNDPRRCDGCPFRCSCWAPWPMRRKPPPAVQHQASASEVRGDFCAFAGSGGAAKGSSIQAIRSAMRTSHDGPSMRPPPSRIVRQTALNGATCPPGVAEPRRAATAGQAASAGLGRRRGRAAGGRTPAGCARSAAMGGDELAGFSVAH